MRITLLSVSLVLLSCVSAMAQLSPVQLGRASNAFTILRPEQNQVMADHNSNSVVFIHRQDVTVWGGGTAANGQIRYDLSNNGGATFTNDIGILNNTYSQPARYPQIVKIGNDGNPFNNGLVWTAPTIDPLGFWDGFVNGISATATSSPFSTELYSETGNNTLLQGGLCEGLNGEFWQADFLSPGGVVGDSLRILKGTFVSVSGNVVWDIHQQVHLDHYTGFDGGSRQIGPNMMFSPSGQDGWVGYLGDLNGGSDSTFNPIFIHSANGGATWGAPIEVDLANVAFEGAGNTLTQELQALWEDSPGVPTSSGRATCTFEYDMTVDANGNPHMLVVVGSASTNSTTPAYTVYSGLAKLAVDIFSEDGGVTWKAVKVAPIYAFRGNFGTPDPVDGSLLDMDNFPQISRTQDGSKIFYSWADSDTTVTGFGIADNLAPNLRVAARRLSDGFMTCPKWITLGDATWDGEMLFPTMAPEVLTTNSGTAYNLPIVSLDMITNDQFAACQFWYWGGEATIDDVEFSAPALVLNTDNCVPPLPPANDNVCDAVMLNIGVNGPFDVTLATAQIGEATPPIGSDLGIDPGCQSQDGWCSIGGEPMVDNSTWYTFVAPASGNVTISLDGSTFDTQVAVWSASSCNDLITGAGTFVGGNDDNPNFLISQYSSEVTATCLTPGATYYVQVDGYQGSEGDALITMVDNNYVADATISATSLVICDGVDETLSAPAGAGFTYAWFGAINSQTLSTSSGGLHWVLVIDTNGCAAADTVNLTIGDTPTAAFTYVANGLSVDFTDVFTGTLDAQTYTFGDGNISNSSNPSHTYAASGTYTVCNSVSNNCGSDVTCQSVMVDITTGIAEEGLGSLMIYPNPSEGSITLEMNAVEGRVQMNLLDITGRSVYSESMNLNGDYRQIFEFDVALGTYVLQLQTDDALISRKLEIK